MTARRDRLKEDIAFDKQLFALFFAAGMASVGWLFTVASNATKVELIYTGVAMGFVAVDTVLLVFLGRMIKNKIRAIEKAE